jgi:hypothetical protein
MGPGAVPSANDFIESDEPKGFQGSWDVDLSSKRPVAEADIGQYDFFDSGEREKRDHLCPMFGRCVPDVRDATLAPSPPNEARNSKVA